MSFERRKFLRMSAAASFVSLLGKKGFAKGRQDASGTSKQVASSRASGPPLMHVLSHVPGGNTVGGEVRESTPRADGYYHIDTPKMIARLKQLNVNTCNYLLWNSPSDWDDLRNEFLPAAQKAEIKVWVYMAPPGETSSSGKGSDPYRVDYEKWAEELAKLSLKYPALVAWAMDDFTWNLKHFPPERIAKLQRTAHAINPTLRFFPVLHFTVLTDQWIADYAPHIDGVVFPYIDLPYDNTQRVSSLDPSINEAHRRLDVPVYVLLYAGRHLASPLEPTPEYISAAIKIALHAVDEGRCGGIISYGTALTPNNFHTQPNLALEGLGRLSLAAARSSAPVGDFAQASQTVSIERGVSQYWLSFWHWDNWGPALARKGQYMKQVLVNDRVVWQGDPAVDVISTWMEGSILQGPLNLTSILKGQKTATLTFRVLCTQAGEKMPIDVGFDCLKATGFVIVDPGFESGQNWNLTDNGQGLLASIDRFRPNCSQLVFDAVAAAYGGTR